MEHREPQHNHYAVTYASVIVSWHIATGVDEWQRRFGHQSEDGGNESFTRYQHAVARFRDSDLSDPAVQLDLAQEQTAGSMEWAYNVTLSEELPGFEGATARLGDVSRILRQLASKVHPDEPRSDGRTFVRYSSYEELLKKAKEVYAPFTGPEIQGAGGTSFLLSCSLERAERDGEVVLFSPEILGVATAPHGRASDFVEQLRDGGLEILDVTGISSS